MILRQRREDILDNFIWLPRVSGKMNAAGCNDETVMAVALWREWELVGVLRPHSLFVCSFEGYFCVGSTALARRNIGCCERSLAGFAG